MSPCPKNTIIIAYRGINKDRQSNILFLSYRYILRSLAWHTNEETTTIIILPRVAASDSAGLSVPADSAMQVYHGVGYDQPGICMASLHQ
jgi:hypothetical protein